jgi:hypothetical protein
VLRLLVYVPAAPEVCRGCYIAAQASAVLVTGTIASDAGLLRVAAAVERAMFGAWSYNVDKGVTVVSI